VIPYVMPAERCHDIDTPYDMRLVEFLLSEQLREGLVKA
jgi:CMP-N,N'-diacetyllegionaminic acid synthase